MSRELLASQKNHSGIVLDPRTKLAVLTTIAVFILGGSYEGVMQYYIIVLAAIPLLLLLSAGKWKGAVLYLLIFGGSLCLELFGLSYLTGIANFIAVAIVGLFLRFTPGIVMGYFVVTTTCRSRSQSPCRSCSAFSRRLQKNGAPLGTPCGCAASALAVERPGLSWNTAWFP